MTESTAELIRQAQEAAADGLRGASTRTEHIRWATVADRITAIERELEDCEREK